MTDPDDLARAAGFKTREDYDRADSGVWLILILVVAATCVTVLAVFSWLT